MTSWLERALQEIALFVLLIVKIVMAVVLIPSILLAVIMFTLTINIAPAAAGFLMQPRGVIALIAITLFATW
ncbi:hypothetical protein M5E06_17770 [Azospirillum sp. A1-3]|uniref:hypothetical protein n=1 Tax=Azospirillum sp. A1-3 TaxID=185874 RepID=UPI0020777AD7|nr:hypothetical protein [Azospirillum sp. A1-3]MCM8735984.1 hypothetical protein [Azospirillum sp. A1-3]